MPNSAVLYRNATAAGEAAERLADYVQPITRLKQATIADHADALAKLDDTLSALLGPDGVLPRTARLADSLDILTPPGHERQMKQAHNRIDAAIARANVVDLGPARRAIGRDVAELCDARNANGEFGFGHGRLSPFIRSTTEYISAFAAVIPSEGVAYDLQSALWGCYHVARGLRNTCLYEARLIDAAYEGAGIAGRAARVSDTLTATAASLSVVYGRTRAAVEPAGHFVMLGIIGDLR